MPKIEKTLKVLQVHIPEPTASSQYAVGTRSKFESTIPNRIGMGNLTGVTFDTHTSTDDTIILPAGRYYIQSSIPVGEPAHSSNSSDDQAYVEWQNFSSSSLNGTYTAFGNKGRSNPGDKLNLNEWINETAKVEIHDEINPEDFNNIDELHKHSFEVITKNL